MDKIVALSQNERVDYRQECLSDLWLVLHNCDESHRLCTKEQEVVDFLNDCSDVVVLYNPAKHDMCKEVRDALFKASKRCRVYILVHDMINCMHEFIGHCLIRSTDVSLAGSFLLHKKGDEIAGIFFTDSLEKKHLNNPYHYLFHLDPEQCQKFWYYFCYVFWHEAIMEYIEINPIQVDRVQQEAFLAPYQNEFDKLFLEEELKRDDYSLILSQSISENITIPQNPVVYVLSNYKENNHEMLKKLGQHHSIFANDHLTFEAKIGDNNSYIVPIMPKGEHLLYALKLNDKQKEDLLHFSKELQQRATYEYIFKTKRQEMSEKEIIFMENPTQKIKIKAEGDFIIASEHFPVCKEFFEKEELQKLKPNFQDFYENNRYICQVNYQWKIVPFYTPDGCKESGLYEQWDKCKKQLCDFISKSLEELRIAEKRGSNIIGKMQKILGLNSVAANKKGLEGLQDKINNNSMNIENFEKYSNELYSLTRKSKETLRCYEAYQKWESDKAQLKKDMDEKEQKFFGMKKHLKEKQDGKQKLEEEYKKTEKIVADLEQQIIELKEQQKEQNIPDRERSIQEATKRKKQQEGEQKSLKHKIDSAEKDWKKIEQDIEKLNAEFEDSKKRFEEFGDFQFTNSSYLSQEDYHLEIPGENLPTIGQLKERNRQRYLEISYWEEVQEAKTEAERLRAQLCVKKPES